MAPLQNPKHQRIPVETRVQWLEIQMLLKFCLYPRRGTSLPVPTATITQALGSCRQTLTFSDSGSDERTAVPTCSYKDYRKHGLASAWLMAGAPCSLKPNPNFIYSLKLEIH